MCCLLLSKLLLLHNSCRTMNVRHAKWTDWLGSPCETWQVCPRQRKYRTYTWFLDLGIDSKAFCFHCWLVIVCFTWGKETIMVISRSSFQHELSAQTSLVFAPRCIPTYPRSTTEKALSPGSHAHLSYDIRLVTWSLWAWCPHLWNEIEIPASQGCCDDYMRYCL